MDSRHDTELAMCLHVSSVHVDVEPYRLTLWKDITLTLLAICILYIPLPGGPFDVGGALSKPYAREQIYARGQKLVLSSSFSSNEERRRFSFSVVLDTWHMDINPL